MKSGPKGITPPGADILGERQLSFSGDWSSDWRGAHFKISLSQAIFAAAAISRGANLVRLACDMGTSDWPRLARDRAVRALRKEYVFMYAGDTHLAAILHHGVEEWSDCGCSPFRLSLRAPTALGARKPGKESSARPARFHRGAPRQALDHSATLRVRF